MNEPTSLPFTPTDLQQRHDLTSDPAEGWILDCDLAYQELASGRIHIDLSGSDHTEILDRALLAVQMKQGPWLIPVEDAMIASLPGGGLLQAPPAEATAVVDRLLDGGLPEGEWTLSFTPPDGGPTWTACWRSDGAL